MLISNTSTMILLAKIGLLGQCLDNFGDIAIPDAVHRELTRKENSFEVLLIRGEIGKKRISIHKTDPRDYSNALKQFRLDEGEAAAYSLFKKEKGKAILTDDRELIKLCRIDNIPFICAMAAVVRLFEIKKLVKEDALEKLKGLYGYGRYSKEVYGFFIKKVLGETAKRQKGGE